MIDYTVGFFFDIETHDKVVLIRKKRPEWQRGLLNGVGGKVEDGEDPEDAMIREFQEETSKEFDNWFPMFSESFPDGVTVHYFAGVGDLEGIQTNTDEEIEIHDIDQIKKLDTVECLQWMIPLAIAAIEEPYLRMGFRRMKERSVNL